MVATFEATEREMSKFGNARLDATCLALGLKEDIKDIININYKMFTGRSAAQLRAKFNLNTYEESSSLRETLVKLHPDLISSMATAEMMLAEMLWRMQVKDRAQALKLAEAVFEKAAAHYHDVLNLETSFNLARVNVMARPRSRNYPRTIREMFW